MDKGRTIASLRHDALRGSAGKLHFDVGRWTFNVRCLIIRQNACAFTLIELLVVLSILTVVAAVIVSAFSGGILVWDTARNFDARRMEALVCLENLERELRNAFRFYGVDFEGDGTRLSFAGLINDADTGQTNGNRIGRILYGFDREENRIHKRLRSYPFSGADEGRSEDVLSNVEDVRFSYLSGNGKGGPAWKESWPDEGRNLPAGVRVELALGEEDRTITICRTILMPARAAREREQPEEEK